MKYVLKCNSLMAAVELSALSLLRTMEQRSHLVVEAGPRCHLLYTNQTTTFCEEISTCS